MLDTEHKFYRRNRDKFLKNYPDKYVVIVGKQVIGAFESHTEAYAAARKDYDVGMFIIKYIKTSVADS